MKAVFLSLLTLVMFTVRVQANPPEVNEKVLKVFNESYAGVSEVKWFEYDTYYEAGFKQNNIRVTARYDFDGNILSTVRYYEGEQLHPFIMGKLRKKYGDKPIHGVTERVTETDVEYFIVINDEKHWITVKSNGLGDMMVTEKMKKGQP